MHDTDCHLNQTLDCIALTLYAVIEVQIMGRSGSLSQHRPSLPTPQRTATYTWLKSWASHATCFLVSAHEHFRLPLRPACTVCLNEHQLSNTSLVSEIIAAWPPMHRRCLRSALVDAGIATMGMAALLYKSSESVYGGRTYWSIRCNGDVCRLRSHALESHSGIPVTTGAL